MTKLQKCPACENEVSTKSENCQHCGQPIRRGFLGRSGTERALNTIVLILILLAAFASCPKL